MCSMFSTKTKGSARLEGHDQAHDGRRLKRLLQEARDVARDRTELDGDSSDHIEQLIDELQEHIGAVERGEAAPDPDRFRHWLDSVSGIPAGSPYKWRRASRRPLAPLRPLVSTKANAATGSTQQPKKTPGKVA